MGIVTELFKLGMKTAVKQADEVVPRVVSQIDETSDILKTLGRKESDISDFHSKYFRGDHKERYRSKDLQEEAIKLNEGLIGLDDFIKSRDTIKPLKTYGTVPPLNKQTDEAGKLIAPDVFDSIEIVGPLGKDKVDKSGIIGVNKNIKEGERVTSRFDIDAYNMYDRYIAAIQTKVKGKFKLKGYSPTAVLKDVKFNYRPNQAFAIAQGKGKSPFATMEGNWKNLTPEETHKYANKKIETKEWTEVGFDPAGRLSFYNRATGEPVFNAEEVIQVGAMLLARGIKKPTKKQLEKLNIETKAGEIIRYKEGGQVLPIIEKNIGGQVLEGLDGEYMRQRNSKEKLEGIMGIPQIQPRQYGGGLDDAYMNRRSAFAAPDANSAFASPMGRGGLPTIYRANGGDYEADDYGNYSQADLDAAMDTSNADTAGDFGDEGGSYQKQMEAALSGQAPGTSKTADELLEDTSLGYTPFELATIYRGKEGKDNQDTARRMSDKILDDGSRTALMNALYGTVSGKGGWHGVEEFIANMSPQALANFNAAANGKSFGGDMGANDFSKGWRFGGPKGTLQDILERELQGEVNINDLGEQAKYRKTYEKEFEKSQLSGFELEAAGLKDFASDIADKFSIQSNLTDDPYIMDEIAERANAAGLNFQPVSPFMAGLMDFGISALGGLVFPGAGALAKGLSNMTGAGRTIGTVTKNGLNYNLSDTGKFSLNTDPISPDYGNDEEPKKRSKPVEEKITETVTEDKPLTDMAGLLAKRDEPVSREASNKYSRDLLDSLGYGNVNIG